MSDPSEYWNSEYWKTMAQQDLPYLPTPYEVVEQLFVELDRRQLLPNGIKLVDLGSGDGRVIVYAADHFHVDATGVEINRELIETTQSTIENHPDPTFKNRCRVIEYDLYDFDLSPYDLIFLFVLPTNHRYLHHMIERIRSGTVVVSIRWELDTFAEIWAHTEKITPLPDYPVFIYRKK
jgi:hypothetical protein